jgi:hypothetical protein
VVWGEGDLDRHAGEVVRLGHVAVEAAAEHAVAQLLDLELVLAANKAVSKDDEVLRLTCVSVQVKFADLIAAPGSPGGQATHGRADKGGARRPGGVNAADPRGGTGGGTRCRFPSPPCHCATIAEPPPALEPCGVPAIQAV